MFRELLFDSEYDGKIFFHHMPAKKESWEYFLHYVEKEKINFIVCLTAQQEILDKSPEYALIIEQNNLPCERLVFEIEDFGIPNELQEYAELIKVITEKFTNGEKGLIHCMGGIGRTGMTAMCMLQELGIEYNEAVELVRETGSGPETKQQEGVVENYYLNKRKNLG